MNELWLIKNKAGRIFGPYSEKEVCFYIQEGDFKDEEFYSPYPTGKWKPLSVHPVFYDKLLAKINAKSTPVDTLEKTERLKNSISKEVSIEQEVIEPTRIITSKKPKASKKKSKIKIKLSEKFKQEVLEDEGVSEVIEMKELTGDFIKDLKTSLIIPGFLLISLLLAFAFFYFHQHSEEVVEEQVRLLSVKDKRTPWSQEELKSKLKKGLFSYYKGTVFHYLNSQMQYVQALEGNPETAEIYLHLCLVYLELWPFAYQDTKDREVLNKTLNMVSQYDKGGVYSGMCKSVQALINKKPEQSLMITNSFLSAIDDLTSIFFYYIKAKALQDLNQYSEARRYLQNVYTLRPEWTAPYMNSANMFYDERQYDLAGKIYQKVLSVFPKHISAGLRMGILEYKYFKKVRKSEERLHSILVDLNDFVEPNILIEAYIILANIYFQRNNKEQALKYSNKAYALDPVHPDVQLLKTKFDKSLDFSKVKVQARGLIYKGDILVRQGNCVEAKKHFERAYNASHKKNALAALRMAQCHWQSGASGQAIRWLKRTINADSKMLEAYFLFADYLSALYDFEGARDVLSAVKEQNPSNYDLLKANALLSFRQEQYQTTITYTKRALKFYTSDIDSYILLSKAYLALNEGHQAFFYAEKAIQEDINNIPAQIAYALALDSAYSSHRAIDHFTKLIDRFPLIIEYYQAFGEYYFNKHMYDEALVQFQHIIQQRLTFKSAYIYLGRIHSNISVTASGRGEHYDLALKYFLEATLLDIADPEPVFYIGLTHFQHKNYEAAEQEFEKILQMNPNYPLIHYYIGLMNFHQQGEKNLDKALKFARNQSTKNPNHYISYKLAGDIYKLRAKGVFAQPQERKVVYELCATEYQKALKHLKDDISISIGLIECYKGVGNLDSALQLALYLVKTKDLTSYPELYRVIGNIYEAKEEYKKAWSKYVEYFKLYPGAEDRVRINARIRRLINEKRALSTPVKR